MSEHAINVKQRLEGAEAQAESLTRRMAKIDGHVGTLLAEYKALRQQIDELNARMIDHEAVHRSSTSE